MDGEGEVVRGPHDGDRPEASLQVAIVAVDRQRRDAWCDLLGGHPSVAVCLAVEDPTMLQDTVRHVRPAVVLVDTGTDHATALACCVQLHRMLPMTGIIVAGLVVPCDGIADLVAAGATAFLMADATANEMLATVHDAARGERSLPSALTHSLFAQLVRERAAVFDVSDGVTLTLREREISALLAEGLSNKEIAARLHIAIHTVKSHVHNILGKLSLRSRLEVVAHARSVRGRS